jgi:hypothetical protein
VRAMLFAGTHRYDEASVTHQRGVYLRRPELLEPEG